MKHSVPTLREIAQAASDRHGGKRGRALGREAERLGLTLSYTTVDKILAGTYTSRPKRVTLEALSVLSGVPLPDVYAAAGEPLPQAPLGQQLPPEADLLDMEQRRVVIDLVRLLARHQLDLTSAGPRVRAPGDRRTSASVPAPRLERRGRREPPPTGPESSES